jgi:hypothetical protein
VVRFVVNTRPEPITRLYPNFVPDNLQAFRYTPAVPLLTDLEAFLSEHRCCGDLDDGVQVGRVWLTCTCGAVISKRDDE